MTVSTAHIIEDTLRRGISWVGFQTLINAGRSTFDFPSILAQNAIYYTSQGIARFTIKKFYPLESFSPETQRMVVYATTFFATSFLVPQALRLIGRSIVWQDVIRGAAASTVFWYFLNSSDEFARDKS